MLKQISDPVDNIVSQQPRKSSVWRDGVTALLASVGVGVLAASILTAVVFAMTTVAVG